MNKFLPYYPTQDHGDYEKGPLTAESISSSRFREVLFATLTLREKAADLPAEHVPTEERHLRIVSSIVQQPETMQVVDTPPPVLEKPQTDSISRIRASVDDSYGVQSTTLEDIQNVA